MFLIISRSLLVCSFSSSLSFNSRRLNQIQQHGYLRCVDLIDQSIAPIVQLLLLLLPLSDPLCSDLLLLFLLGDLGAHLRYALPDLLELEIVFSPLRGDVGLQLVDV
jgi:hypothetical protein